MDEIWRDYHIDTKLENMAPVPIVLFDKNSGVNGTILFAKICFPNKLISAAR